jgi:virginiamycin A acetyltransferase
MSISIGKYSYINEPYSSGWYDSALLSDGKKPTITIGRYSSIGKNCQFILTQHNYKNISTSPLFGKVFCRGNIKIGNDVWIGMNATIMDCVEIGDGAVVGAGSVVTTNVPPYAIAAGNPCRIIKYRFSPDNISKLLELRWWDLEKEELLLRDMNENKDIESFIETMNSYRLLTPSVGNTVVD